MEDPGLNKADWGKKRTCDSCGARFYDLGRKVPACPKCGHQEGASDTAAEPDELPGAVETEPLMPADANAEAALGELEIDEAAEDDDSPGDDPTLMEQTGDKGEKAADTAEQNDDVKKGDGDTG